MQAITDAQTIELRGLEIGRYFNLVITGAESSAVVEFRNASIDGDWHEDPRIDGNESQGVIIQRFECVSTAMRVNFSAAPSADYELRLISSSEATF